MSTAPGRPSDWPRALRRYLGVSLTAHLLWEVVQLPLYTIWTTGTGKQRAFAVLHCTAGDAMIAGLSLLVALAVMGEQIIRLLDLVELKSMRDERLQVDAS